MRTKSVSRLFTVVALAGLTMTAHAGTDLVITPLPDPHPGLKAFLVKAVADVGDLVGSIIGLNLTNAHQIWRNAAIAPSPANQSSNLDAMPAPFWGAQWTPWDSHLKLNLSTSPSLTVSPGFGTAETNDGSNPAPLTAAELVPSVGFEAFPGTAGIGSLSFTGASAQVTLLAPRPTTLDFLQIVVPNGTSAFLSVTFESDNLDRDVFSNVEVGASDPNGPENTPPVVNDQNTVFPAHSLTVYQLLGTDAEDGNDANLLWSWTGLSGPGVPAIAPTLSPSGSLSWDTTGSANGVYMSTITANDLGNPSLSDDGILRIQVPEPGAIVLAGLSLIGIFASRRRIS